MKTEKVHKFYSIKQHDPTVTSKEIIDEILNFQYDFYVETRGIESNSIALEYYYDNFDHTDDSNRLNDVLNTKKEKIFSNFIIYEQISRDEENEKEYFFITDFFFMAGDMGHSFWLIAEINNLTKNQSEQKIFFKITEDKRDCTSITDKEILLIVKEFLQLKEIKYSDYILKKM